MYGQGHYAPQLGQSPDRPPRPPFIQQQLSHPPAMAGLTHQVPSAPPHGVIRPAGQQPHAVSPVASAYHSAPPAQSCPSTSIPGSGQCWENNTTVMQPYPKFQLGAQSAQYTSALPPPLGHSRLPPPPPSQNHNLYRHPVHQPPPSMQQMTLPLSAPALPPPPPTFPLQTSSLPSPATLHSIAPSTSGRAHTSSVTSHLPPLPPAPPPFPPPPPSSSTLQSSVPMSSSNPISSDPSVRSLCDPGSTQAQTSESTENILTQDRNRESLPNRGSDCVIERKLVEASALKRDISSTPSVTVDVPTSPPRPTNEKTLRNIEILCQYISENGPAFEDMARQNEAGNPGFEFLFGGEPGSEAAIAHEYFLWMKKKSCIGLSQSNLLLKDKHDESRSSVEPNILKETSYSLSDSDMDMEDDIAQPGEKLSVNDEVIAVKQDFVLSVDAIEIQNKDNLLQSSQSGILTMNLGPQIKLEGDDGGRSDKTFDSITRTEDPFRLLKDYASDDSSECDGVHDPVSALQFQEAIPTTFDRSKLQDVSESETTEIGHSGSHMTGAQCEEPKDLDSSLAPKINSKEVIRRPSSLEKKVDSTAENNSRADSSKRTTHANLEKKDNLESSGVDLVSESGQREHTKSAGPVKVDEFGRLIREGASETDSDDSGYYRRRGRRGRSRSTSRSPPKRRRRSPWRRKERRSLSRSWSPKRRRSRSRSPLRRVIDTGSKKNMRGRHQMRECFDYLKGRCYRGASCRYLHCDPDKHSQPRHYRSKHHGSETRTSSRDYDYSEENKVTSRKRSLEHGMNGEDGSAVVIDRNNDTAHEGSSVCIHRPSDSKDVTDFSTSDLQNEEKPELPVSCGKDEHVGHSHAESSKQEHRALDNQPLHLKSSYPTSASQISQVSFSQSYLESVGHKELLTADSSATNYPHHVSELQPPLCLPLQPPPPPSSCVASISHIPQPMQNYISAPSEPNVLLSNQHAQYHTPQNLSWGTLPPQCPPSFQQGSLPVRSNPAMHPSLSSTKPTDVPIHPQVGNLQRSYMSMPGSHQPSQHVDAMHPGNLLGQATAGSISTRDDPYVNSLFSGPSPSSPFLPGNIPPRPASTMREANSSIMQSFSHEFLPPGEPSNSGSQNPPYLQQPYGLYQAAGDSFRDPSHHSADLHRNHPSSISDIGPRITAHYNPYASTFDQPLNYKFSSDVFRQGEKTYGRDNSFSLARAPFEAQEVACGVSPMIPSPHSSRAGGQALPKSGGDQYDPLFDSIEPSAESPKKQSAQDDHAADNSDIMLRLSGSKTSDAKLSTEKKVLGDFAAATSSESDEFGETAHAEVLAAEAGSQSNLNDDAEVSAGDVEIYQVKRDGKSKTNKDSRSMKLFKAELASFVKDMLKPSWRQGNMSKEAFKTIVKKTVEKVSGAIKGHRVPKSKAKIDQYIDRSQRKLTSLVEGYVNKYAKA